jgi:hypothetical protein
MGCLGLTFSYMQCSNMLHKCEKNTEKVYGNFPETFRKFSSLVLLRHLVAASAHSAAADQPPNVSGFATVRVSR